MKVLCRFNTIERFWQYMNHIPKPADVFFDGDYRKKVGPEGKTIEEFSLFRRGIEPEWGDPQNASGGEWFCRQNFDGDALNMLWLNLVLATIGGTIEESAARNNGGGMDSHINGVRVVDKSKSFPMFRLEIWINTRDKAVKESIREHMLDIILDQVPFKKGSPNFQWKDHC
mmetsp:Transcript_7109/g.10874  ORF Transcript_7109/g.10874 Transcript_7109/m.10874 type:complete len:171 (+) Transcript_7109:122-634(+)|eukprot:CAMPEP_0118705698 /NCGR_PEP_ID=MMETSP0800-20121206/20024_1 /TAXON_ID=210618 ORGANISM="Striatella unipunctata, Strain CCMP2910" /NCGR_SAMPLE_ID=MMETSP0800 /ASSEMBLY_ACC=CAM_ASM_000638 /LENGTH=170 /DNA_ID=CAMNT_0006607905 /DNA_START=444 /DNA_END=956 /DNA_ORIENTATION=+